MIGGTIDPPKSLTHASGICPPAAGRDLDETAGPGAHSPPFGAGAAA